MDIITENRRDFLKKMALSTASLALLANCRYEATAQKTEDSILETIKRNAIQDVNGEWSGAISVPADVSTKTELLNETDKGEPIKISGTVFQADGKTPAPNTLIYIYHTDFEGYYGRSRNVHRHGKYRGWMLTNKDGRYAFNTIKPAPYPANRFAAHIHMTVTTATTKEDWVDSILFEGDSLISSQERSRAGQKGGFNPIVSFTKGDGGLLYATRDIHLIA